MKSPAPLLPVAFLFTALASAGFATPPAAAAAAPAQSAAANAAFAARLDRMIAGSWRAPADVARDRYRHPRETLEFFGLHSGQSVIEITPGGGWYSAILAPLLRGDGAYIAALETPQRADGEAASNETALERMFRAHPEEYDQARTVMFDPKAPVLGPPDSADVVLTFRNAHNWAQAGTAAAMFKAFFAVLKPDGTLGVVDHRAAPGKTLAQAMGSGYLPQDYVIQLATDAGFRLVAKCEINANPKDTHEHPKGVWTLPPTLQLGQQDRAKYLAIGESDRMTLRFEKPAGAARTSGD